MKKPTKNKKIDSQRRQLKDIQASYNIEINNRYTARPTLIDNNNAEKDIETKWNFLKNTMNIAATNAAGFKQSKKKKWISENTWIKIQERKQKKENLLSARTPSLYVSNKQRYALLDKEVKADARKDKNNFINNLSAEAEIAAKTGNSKTLFHIMRQLCNHPPTKSTPIKDTNGKLLASDEEEKQMWAEHFKEILNRPQPTITPVIGEEENMSILTAACENFTIEELKQAIRKLKNNKATGEDEISGEMLKSADEKVLQHLLLLFNDVWQNESPLQEWKNGAIFKLPKKGDLSDCNNWRGITLLSVPGKLFCSILLERIKKSIDERLREEQAGFRPHRSVIDHIFTLRTIIEESVEFQSQLIINFVDFQKSVRQSPPTYALETS